MKRTEIFIYSILVILLITGFFVDGFPGGLITGASLMSIIIVTAALKNHEHVQRLNKRIKELKREAEIW
jgi:TRAP-type C4-dicarboxylate transport system permease large subunit